MAEGTAGADHSSLRVGLMLSGPTVRRWQASVIDSLLATPGVDIGGIVVDARPPSTRRRPRSDILWDLYNNRWVARRSRALEVRPLPESLDEVPRIRCIVEKRGRWSEHFAPTDVAEIRGLDLDVLLRFGFGIIRGEILESARYGVWSFHHDDDREVRGGPPAFWEIVDSDPLTGVVLQRLTDRLDGGQVLHRGSFATKSTSYVRNTDHVHLGAVEWPSRVCAAVLAGDASAASGTPSASDAPIRRNPTNRTAAGFVARQAGRWALDQATQIATAEEWDVGIVREPIERFLDPAYLPEVEWLDLGGEPHIYAADPFYAELGGRPTILFERFDQRTRRGEIWRHDLVSRESAPASLDVDGHASYPFMLQEGGKTYCLPQVSGDRCWLYTWSQEAWRRELPIGPDEPLLDATVVRHDGRWWLMGTKPGEWSLTHLYVWWAEELAGHWVPHILNPVKSDVRSARPAGTPFEFGGKLYRPAQDCAAGYGSAVAITQIDVLTPTHFSEQTVRVLRPQPGWHRDRGIHTLSRAGADRTLVDAKRFTVNRHAVAAELRGRARNAVRPP